ncbi:MAG: GNAT family N-acetyltransferase [Rhizobiaceae bacterium]|nr:GNAT family N-acetyltransferase [Rhizobiaceae bacterium]
MIKLVERDFASFFAAPFNAYANSSVYVSPLKSDLKRFLTAGVNPLFQSDDDFTYFTAVKDDAPVGRITAHVHRASNERFGTRRAYFGFFDCVNDDAVAGALLKAAEDWAVRHCYTEIAGNFNLTAMQQIGVQTDNFDAAVFTDQVHSPAHISRMLERLGYERHFPMTTFQQDIAKVPTDNLIGEEEKHYLRENGFRFAPVTRKTLNQRLEDARTILNESFVDNPMFVPLTKAEFEFQSKEMKLIMDPRISTVMFKDDEVVGAVIAIPDLNPMLKDMGSKFGLTMPWHFIKHRLNRKRAVVIFQGVRPKFQGMGVNPLMLAHIIGNMKLAGYETVGGTWISDENAASLRQAEKGGAKPLHRLHLYRKSLT